MQSVAKLPLFKKELSIALFLFLKSFLHASFNFKPWPSILFKSLAVMNMLIVNGDVRPQLVMIQWPISRQTN